MNKNVMTKLEWQRDWFNLPKKYVEKAVVSWTLESMNEKKQVLCFDVDRLLRNAKSCFKTTCKNNEYISKCGDISICWTHHKKLALVTSIKNKGITLYVAPETFFEASGITYIKPNA